MAFTELRQSLFHSIVHVIVAGVKHDGPHSFDSYAAVFFCIFDLGWGGGELFLEGFFS